MQQPRLNDIDIALKGTLSRKEVGIIHTQLDEETSLPYFFDVIDYNAINNQELKSEIDKNGKLIYSKSQN